MKESLWRCLSVPPRQRMDAVPFLFVHGDFATGMMTWSRQWSALSACRPVLVVDRRGHGASPRDPKPYTIAGDAHDVLEVAQQHFEGRVALVGHSYGALVCLEAALLAPHRVQSLHLIEPPLLALASDDPVVARFTAATRRLHAAAPSQRGPELAKSFFRTVAGQTAVQELEAKPVWQAIVAEADRFAHEEFAGDYPAERIAGLCRDVSVTIYSGGRSHPALAAVARRLHQRIVHSRLVTFPGGGHDLQRLGAPFNQALLAYT